MEGGKSRQQETGGGVLCSEPQGLVTKSGNRLCTGFELTKSESHRDELGSKSLI